MRDELCGQYMALRKRWNAALNPANRGDHEAEARKASLFDQLSKAWRGLTRDEQREVGVRCVNEYHWLERA